MQNFKIFKMFEPDKFIRLPKKTTGAHSDEYYLGGSLKKDHL